MTNDEKYFYMAVSFLNFSPFEVLDKITAFGKHQPLFFAPDSLYWQEQLKQYFPNDQPSSQQICEYQEKEDQKSAKEIFIFNAKRLIHQVENSPWHLRNVSDSIKTDIYFLLVALKLNECAIQYVAPEQLKYIYLSFDALKKNRDLKTLLLPNNPDFLLKLFFEKKINREFALQLYNIQFKAYEISRQIKPTSNPLDDKKNANFFLKKFSKNVTAFDKNQMDLEHFKKKTLKRIKKASAVREYIKESDATLLEELKNSPSKEKFHGFFSSPHGLLVKAKKFVENTSRNARITKTGCSQRM